MWTKSSKDYLFVRTYNSLLVVFTNAKKVQKLHILIVNILVCIDIPKRQWTNESKTH